MQVHVTETVSSCIFMMQVQVAETVSICILYIYININKSVKNDKIHLAGTLQKEYRDQGKEEENK